MVKAYLKERYHKPGNVYLGTPHLPDEASPHGAEPDFGHLPAG
jgi:hypothetical protein